MNYPALIAAIAFALLVVFLAIPLFKLGQVFSQLQKTVERIGNEAEQTVKEATIAVRGANSQIDKVDAITTSTAQIAQDMSALSTLLSSTCAKPFIKIAAFSHATRAVFSKNNDSHHDSE